MPFSGVGCKVSTWNKNCLESKLPLKIFQVVRPRLLETQKPKINDFYFSLSFGGGFPFRSGKQNKYIV